MPPRRSSRPLPLFLFLLLLPATAAVYAQTLQLTPGDILRRAVPSATPAPATPAVEEAPAPPTQSPQPAPPAPAVAPPVSPLAKTPSASPEKDEGPPVRTHGYLYLEPEQARFEALFDIESLLLMLGETAQPDAQLDEATRQRLLKAMAERAVAWCKVYDGRTPLPGTMAYPALLTGKPGATLPVEPGQKIPVRELMLGLIWLFPLPPSPTVVETQWQGFFPESGEIPVTLFWGPKSQPSILTLKKPFFTWQNLNRLPVPAPLVQVPSAAHSGGISIPAGFLIWLAAGLALWRTSYRLREKKQKLPGGTPPYLIVWAATAVLLWPRLHIPLPGLGGTHIIETPEQAARIVEPLLLNAYRAFDHRSESAIYDVLARSVEGELLRRLYLETIEALSIEGREEARVTVREFSAEVDSVTPTDGGFSAQCEWTALGTVGHWGHTHTRVNRYKARITIKAIAGAWKLTALDVDEAMRL